MAQVDTGFPYHKTIMKISSLLGLLLLGTPILSEAAVYSVTGPVTYTQDFNTLANTGSPTWANDSTIESWYAERASAGAFTAYSAGAGGSNTGALYSFGAADDTDRTLGSVSSGTPANIAYGFGAINNSTDAINLATITFTGEQWRNGGNTSAQPLTFWYQVASAPFTSLTPATNTGWTQVTTLTFTSPTVGATAGALDGNDPANRTTLTSNVEITLNPGEFIMLRWLDINDAGNDHGMGIDDLSLRFAPVPEPSSTLLGILAGLGLMRRRR